MGRLVPAATPPFFTDYLFETSESTDSSARKLRIMGRGFAAMAMFFTGDMLLLASFPSESLPSGIKGFVELSFSVNLPFSTKALVSPSSNFSPRPKGFYSGAIDFPSVSLVSSTPSLDDFGSSTLG